MPERGEASDRLAKVKGDLRQNEFVYLFPKHESFCACWSVLVLAHSPLWARIPAKIQK